MTGGMHGRGPGRGHAWQILPDIVNEQVVHILLEYILVTSVHGCKGGVSMVKWDMCGEGVHVWQRGHAWQGHA